MDRVCLFKLRRHASLPCVPTLTTLSRRNSDEEDEEEDAKPSTSSVGAGSKPADTHTPVSSPIGTQPAQSIRSPQIVAQTQAQAQARPVNDADVLKPKKKSMMRKKKGQASRQSASSRGPASQKELLELAQTLVNQNEAVVESGQNIFFLIRDTCYESQETREEMMHNYEEIVEINEKLMLMEAKFDEAKKQLDKAQVLSRDVVNPGWRMTESELIKEIKAMSMQVGSGKVGTWPRVRTNKFLEDFKELSTKNAKDCDSPFVNSGIKCLAEHLIYHANYDDEYTPMLFHLANGHNFKAFLDKSREEDQKAASVQEAKYTVWPRTAPKIKKSATRKSKKSGVGKGCGSNEGSTPGTKPPVGKTKCANCKLVEAGKFEEWVAELRRSMEAATVNPGPGERAATFMATLSGITKAAKAVGISVSFGTTDDNLLSPPALNFIPMVECKKMNTDDVLKSLGDHALKEGFHLSRSEEGGNVGYQIVPLEALNSDYFNRAQVLRGCKDMFDSYMVEALRTEMLDKVKLEEFQDLIWSLTLEHYSKNIERFNRQHGLTGTGNAHSPELSNKFSVECVGAAIGDFEKKMFSTR